MIQLNICHPPHDSWTLTFSPESSGLELKIRLLTLLSASCAAEELRLVCAGRVIQDEKSLSSQGVVDKSKVYVSIKKTTNSNSSSSNSPSLNVVKPKKEEDPMMGPLLKFLSDNPELYQQMIMSNPQMRQLVEKNPELGHALSDPSTLKSMLNAATNPRAYNEMLRGHDRMMSNLENIPEGFSHLKKIYSTLQEPMYDALTPQRTRNYNTNTSTSNISNNITSEPIPNPWAPPAVITPIPKQRSSGSPVFGFRAQSQKRKLTTDDNSSLEKSMETMRLLSPLGDPFERFRNELEVMHKLGYTEDEEENIPALMATDGHVSSAINIILNKRKTKK